MLDPAHPSVKLLLCWKPRLPPPPAGFGRRRAAWCACPLLVDVILPSCYLCECTAGGASIAKAIATFFFQSLLTRSCSVTQALGRTREHGDVHTLLVLCQVHRLVTGVAVATCPPPAAPFFWHLLVTLSDRRNWMLFRDHPDWPQGNTWCSKS